MITLVLGGARSGKSEVAERLTQRHDGPLVYLATGRAGDDADMAARIEAHRRRRDSRFEVIEAGAELVAALRAAPPRPVLVDALGTWLAAHRDFDAVAAGGVDELCAALAARTLPTVLVSDEVGLGVHPETAVGRAFRDALGLVNQRVAAVADEVWLVVAGRVLRLDPPPS